MKKIIVVPGLLWGLSGKNYQPLAEVFGEKDFLLFRADSDRDPAEIAEEIKSLQYDEKVVICLSMGAMVGNLLAKEANIKVFYICPFLGKEFLNRQKKWYARKFSGLFRMISTIGKRIFYPFRWHRWWPLFGGTKPDGHYLSIYAIFKQLEYCFGDAPKTIEAVDGVIYSIGDRMIDREAIKKYFPNSMPVIRDDGDYPAHVNMREEWRKFGQMKASTSSEMGEDGKAYIEALEIVSRNLG